MSTSPYRKARRRVRAKKGFYYHFAVYFCIISFLAFVNVADFDGEVWFVYPMMAWGIAIAMHYVGVFGIPGSKKLLSKEWEEREMERELRKFEYLEQKKYESEIVPPPYDQNEVNEELELKDFKKLRNEWEDTDFV